jgi:predicted nucleic acid-binding protein
MEEEGLSVVAGPLTISLPDPDDQPFWEVALAAGAEALVTGDKRHFPKRAYQGVKIVSPLEFLERWSTQIGSC